ncbi:MAG: PilZ domain-containing protein [Planctomycetota bacterium]|nr:MAG: PilZ domain-containing protein [Planctomycetota bacterium]
MHEERRQHRRLNIRLPLECYPAGTERERVLRTVTRDISTGGMYFEMPLFSEVSVPKINSLLDVELTVPPGDGYFPYVGHVRSVAEVVRCEPLPANEGSQPDLPSHIGVAAKFHEPLKLNFP